MFFSMLPFIVFSLLHVLGEAFGSLKIRYASKPFLLPALALFYILNAEHISPIMLLALAGGWLGDLFLMIPDKNDKRTWFKLGLVSFLLGHIFYCLLFFAAGGGLPGLPWGLVFTVLFAAASVIIFFRLKPHMGPLFFPITLYIVVIALMGVSTAFCYGHRPDAAVFTVIAGAIIFMASDTVNAWNRFAAPVPHERVITMSTYLAGQLLLVWGYLLF